MAAISGKCRCGAVAFEAAREGDRAEHIFVGEKGDYYDIAGGLPQKPWN